MRSAFALALIGVTMRSACAQKAFTSCCAYGGEGSAVALGAGVLDPFPPQSNGAPPSGPAYAAPMAVGVSTTRSFATILFAAASGPEDARAGWIITSNATHDVIFVFANVSATPTCTAGVGARGSMVGAYKLCGGAGGTFDTYVRDFLLTPATRVSVFEQASAGGAVTSTVAFADADACAPVSLLGSSSPFGTGSYSINFESGVAAEPPASWSQPPSWCDGKWAWGGV